MVQLLPGSTAATAIATLEEAMRSARNTMVAAEGSIEKLNAYRLWSNQQIRALSAHLTPATVEDVVATRRYWVLQSIDPAAYGLPALAVLIELELTDCISALEAAAKRIEARLEGWGRFGWGPHIDGPGNPAIILDTNVLLQHAHELLNIDWNTGIGVRRGVSLSLGIPMTVVEELDRLKLSTGHMRVNGKDVPRRTLARTALDWLDRTFPDGQFSKLIRQGMIIEGQPTSDLHAVLMIDELRRDRLARPEVDILDDAVGLRAFVASVAVATSDRAMTFRARSLGVHAFRPLLQG